MMQSLSTDQSAEASCISPSTLQLPNRRDSRR
jgi:hypothetical protein